MISAGCKQASKQCPTSQQDCLRYDQTSHRQDIQGAQASSKALSKQQEGCRKRTKGCMPLSCVHNHTYGAHAPAPERKQWVHTGSPAAVTLRHHTVLPHHPTTISGPHRFAGVACTSTPRTDAQLQHMAACAGQDACWSYMEQVKGSCIAACCSATHLNTHKMHNNWVRVPC